MLEESIWDNPGDVPYDIYLLDVNLTGMDGIQLAKEIRS